MSCPQGGLRMRKLLRKAARAALGCLAIVAVLASAAPAFAQTTGRLVGTIVDAQGAVLPGVTVTVTSPQLQGANTTVTDATGQFRFPSLPPGVYHVKAELSSFKSVDQSDVRLGIDQTVAGADGTARRAPRHLRGHALRPRRDAGHLRPVVLRIDQRREQLHHRRPQHDRRQHRHGRQGAERRLHPGSPGADRRLERGVRPAHRRQPERHHEVGRQHVPHRRLRLRRGRRPAGGEHDGRASAANDDDDREHGEARRLRRRSRRLPREGQSVVLRRVRSRRAPRRGNRDPAVDRAGRAEPRQRDSSRHHAESLRRQAHVEAVAEPHDHGHRDGRSDDARRRGLLDAERPGLHDRGPAEHVPGRARFGRRRLGRPLRRGLREQLPGQRDGRPAS
ncbi:MAG: hypothetical protein DMF93_25645 [Acidobacteria bacterium]|nr:MAG: hypothetical protein DMF93_25645 [Acidobacteriota bacterium]